jgi:hypothetical protein
MGCIVSKEKSPHGGDGAAEPSVSPSEVQSQAASEAAVAGAEHAATTLLPKNDGGGDGDGDGDGGDGDGGGGDGDGGDGADMKQIADDVTRTWGLVAAGPLEPVGVAFFLKIFEIAPEALRMCPHVSSPHSPV